MKVPNIIVSGLLVVVQAQYFEPSDIATTFKQSDVSTSSSFESTIMGDSGNLTQGQVAAHAAIQAGASQYQVKVISDAMDSKDASAATASTQAGLSESQSVQVIKAVIDDASDVPSNAEAASTAASNAGATTDQVQHILNAVVNGSSVSAAANTAGLSDSQIAQIMDSVMDAAGDIADPADVAAVAAINSGATSIQALEIASRIDKGEAAASAAVEVGVDRAAVGSIVQQVVDSSDKVPNPADVAADAVLDNGGTVEDSIQIAADVVSGISASGAASDAGLDPSVVADIVDQVADASENVASAADVAGLAAWKAGSTPQQVQILIHSIESGVDPGRAAVKAGLAPSTIASVNERVSASNDNKADSADVAADAAANAGASNAQVAEIAASIDKGISPADATSEAGLSGSIAAIVSESVQIDGAVDDKSTASVPRTYHKDDFAKQSSLGQVAAAAVVDVGASMDQASQIAKLVDVKDESAASASSLADLSDEQTISVITAVVQAAHDVPTQADIVTKAASEAGAPIDVVQNISNAVQRGSSVVAAASAAGLSNSQIVKIINQATDVTDAIADPADVAAATAFENGATARQAIGIARSVGEGTSATSAATAAGLSSDAVVDIVVKVAETSKKVADPADVALDAALENGASTVQAIKIGVSVEDGSSASVAATYAGLTPMSVANIVDQVTDSSSNIADQADVAAATAIANGASSDDALQLALSIEAGDSSATAAKNIGLSPSAVLSVVDTVTDASANVASPADVAADAAFASGASITQVAKLTKSIDGGADPVSAAVDTGLSTNAVAAIGQRVADAEDRKADTADVAADAAANAGALPDQIIQIASAVDGGASPAEAVSNVGLPVSAVEQVNQAVAEESFSAVKGIALAASVDSPKVSVSGSLFT
ncbi:Aste57867_2531 [Aphanomyces stellatus]|uniref:Aste57867_2531 protein n=1 Tax=Aphanomyces stellatus TaxID=120398 RepID=A0A485K8V9_9STRA|nr:hypothetical protein As57867_002524 [Aphanomyces stellatus]VFT79730.1 Aste57867_2531 [Aphanomyces stellatus]